MIGVISYLTSAILFATFTLVLFTGRQGTILKQTFAFTCLVTTFWSLVSAAYPFWSEKYGILTSLLFLAEVARNLAWIGLLYLFLRPLYLGFISKRNQVLIFIAFVVFNLAFILSLYPVLQSRLDLQDILPSNFVSYGNLVFSIIGLVMVEQLYRHAKSQTQDEINLICIGIGAMFVYDFYLYSHALLLQKLDLSLWEARGFVNALVVPLMGLAVYRNQDWSQDIFLSRKVVFHTTGLLAAGIYLLAMGAGGYYVRIYGGSWGLVAQILFLFAAILILVILFISGQVRARARVWINKHFFHYKYDYREEWLRFISTLSYGGGGEELYERAIIALAQIIQSPAGILWMRDDWGRIVPMKSWQMPLPQNADEDQSSSLVRFLEGAEWVINLEEYEQTPELYQGLVMPGWVESIPDAWLIVPLVLHEHLIGFVLLAQAPIRSDFNWEDCDLLKTASRQAASHLAQLQGSLSLAESRQFEGFHKLSAYILHDLKNLAAQWSLMASNAAKHKNNPDFVDDMIQTVESSEARMSRMLLQLRGGATAEQKPKETFDLLRVLQEVVKERSGYRPAPRFVSSASSLPVKADRSKIHRVFLNLIRNAQEACHQKGEVEVRCARNVDSIEIQIQDTGVGMEASFIKSYLFRPFHSTKSVTGMGIGAFEAKDYIMSLSGQLDVQSQVDQGTTFTIRLKSVAE